MAEGRPKSSKQSQKNTICELEGEAFGLPMSFLDQRNPREHVKISTATNQDQGGQNAYAGEVSERTHEPCDLLRDCCGECVQFKGLYEPYMDIS